MSDRGRTIADSSVVRALPAAAVVAAMVVVARHGGVSYGDLGLYALRIVVAVLLPGVLLSRLVRSGRRAGVEDLAVGFAVGTLVQLPVWWLLVRLDVTYWVFPAVVVAVVGLWPAARRRVLAAELDATPLTWSASVAAICLVALAWLRGDYLRWSPPEPGAVHNYYGDLIFHLSVAGNAKYEMPPTLPQVSGDPLYYHWFAHLDMGLASRMTGIELSTILFQLWVPVILLAGILIVAACGSRISGRLWAGPLAALLVYGTGEIVMSSWTARPFAPMTQFFSWASPTQTFAVILAIPAAGVVVDFVRRQAGSERQLWLLGVPLFIGLGLAKSAELPVFMGGAGILFLIALLRRDRPLTIRSLVAGVALTASFALSVLLFYGRQAGGLSLDPLFTMRQYARVYADTGMDPSASTTAAVLAVSAITVIWLVSVLGRAWGVVLLIPRWRTVDPGLVLLTGILLSGAGAYLLLFHPGGSQTYFMISAFPLGALASAWAICEVAPRLGARTAAVIGVLTTGAGVLAYVAKDAVGKARPTEGFIHQVVFLARPLIILALLSAVLVTVVVIAHRHGLLRDVSAVTVITAVIIAAGLTTTIQYTLSKPDGTSVAKLRADDSKTLSAITGKSVEAERWLRDHSPHDAVIATNRHCGVEQVFPGDGPRTDCNTVSFSVSAWTERRVLVEGWAFSTRTVQLQIENGIPYQRQPFWDQQLLADNDAFFADPTAAGAAELCRAGATYAVLDRRYQPDLPSLEPVARQLYATSDVEVYKLPC
ncbi:hypothetical protein GCM10022234_25280 [Aeromicrobium panaciterrae]|uniref:hypothetical protein n=1 Tax=Aeromicrobium panaciterrae TaxID=363861 RepID=UPI0031E1C9B1